MKKFGRFIPILMAVFLMCAFQWQADAQSKLDQIGGFEGNLPAFWTMGNQPSGSTLTWATDQFKSMGHSIKIEKTATGDSAAWVSDNMCDIWSSTVSANVDLKFGAYIKTMNVNTNPTNEDQKWYIAYTFYDSAGALMGTVKLPIDQSQASSSGWMADTTAVGQISLPKAAWKMIISFVAGKNATGTVWADDFIFIGRGGWAGQDWNTQLGVPTDWFYWLPPLGGNDGQLNKGFENTVVTTEAAHSGTHSLKFDLPMGRDAQDAFVATHRLPFTDIDPSIKPGDVVRISVWLKGSNLHPDSAAKYPSTWSVGLTPMIFDKYGNHDGYDPLSAIDYQFVLPNATSFDWKQFYLDVKIPDTANTSGKIANSLEVRLHVYSTFVGTIYFDDLTVTKLEAPQISSVGGFESNLPSFWMKGNEPNGATLTWATDQSVSMGHSLKIEKSATSDSASWVSENMCDIWSPTVSANVDLKFGALVKTMNVNTNPTTDDQKWYIAYTFYDSAGALMGTIKLPIDQSTASSSGWLGDTTAVGQISLPKAAWKMYISFVAGKNATGTVWADDFMFIGRGGWAGQDWNTAVGVPTGWYYWLPPVGGNDGVLNKGFENTIVTNEAAHSGNYSLKFVLPSGRDAQDGFVGTRRYKFDGSDFSPMNKLAKTTSDGQDISHLTNVQPGDSLRISVWVKASGLSPDSAAKYPSTWAVGVTPQFFTDAIGNNDGYNPIGGNDYQFTFPNAASFDWTKFYVDVQVPDTSTTDKIAKALEVRLHVYSTFVGTVYFDDLSITKITGLTAVDGKQMQPVNFQVNQNYPNPFNPSTVISYTIPHSVPVKVVVYDMLGRQVSTLVNSNQTAGTHNVVWNGVNDLGQKVASGTYLYRVQAGENVQTMKMILLK